MAASPLGRWTGGLSNRARAALVPTTSGAEGRFQICAHPLLGGHIKIAMECVSNAALKA